MSQLRKGFVWFYMLSKRLLHQWGFVILLCAIPIIVFATNTAMLQESGVLRIALCNEAGDELAEKVVKKLLEEDSVILFSRVENPEVAKKGVEKHIYDSAWIFPEDFSEKLDGFVGGRTKKPFVQVFEREDNISLRISKEKLFGAIYSEVSYSTFKNFVYSELVTENDISEAELRTRYDEMPRGRDIIQIEKLNNEKKSVGDVNYLNSPIRGILSLIVVLCALTAAMYFLKDQAEGKFDWMPYKKRIIPALASCFSAALLSSVAVFLAIQFSGISTGFCNEIIPTVLFVVGTAGFCVILCTLVRSPGKLGALVPGILIVMLVLSPIFFNLKVLRPIRLMLPTYYYLKAVYNPKYCYYFIMYIIAVYGSAFILNMIFSNIKNKKFVI